MSSPTHLHFSESSYRKGRVFGIVALVSGLLAMGKCYCTPTAVALLVYGLIIYLNETTKQVFAVGAKGKTWREIEDYCGS